MRRGGSRVAAVAVQGWRHVSRGWPFVVLAGAAVPLVWLAVSVALRADLFGKSDPSKPGQLGAFLTFVGVTLGTVATVFASLLTREHNARERKRLWLEAAIKNLQSLPDTATTARSAGALSTMVLLGQHRVALRVLQPAWKERIVDDATATWLIGQVLTGHEARGIEAGDRVDDAAINEAAVLLIDREDRLTGAKAGVYYFPGHFLRHWATKKALPKQAKFYVLLAMGQMLAYRGRSWWSSTGDMPNWPTNVLLECAGEEPDEDVRCAAAVLLVALHDRFRGDNIPAEEMAPVKALAATAEARASVAEHRKIAERIRREWQEPATQSEVAEVAAVGA